MGASQETAVVIRPRRSLLVAGGLSFLLVSLPLFGALYWLAAQNGTVAPVAIAQAIVSVLVLFAYLRYRRVSFVVDGDFVIERHFIRSDQRTPISSISSIVIAETYRASSVDTLTQLLALDENRVRLFRMRGQFWSKDVMMQLVAAVKIRSVEISEPVSRAEFFEAYPGSAYWYEGSRTVAILGVVLILLLTIALVSGVMGIVGEPISPK
jgi:hypothetical protein